MAAILWNVPLCVLAEVQESSTLMTELTSSSETVVQLYQAT